jgi:hypothetical protein
MLNRRALQRLGVAACFVFLLLFWTLTPSEGPSAIVGDVHVRPLTAIVTTILNPDPSFPVWLEYHLCRVDRILIFMDDPSKAPVFEELVRDKPVVLFNGSAAVPEMTPESRLIYRQDANNNMAIEYALTNHIEWLLHIDIDELFYDDNNSTWRTTGGSENHVGMVRFYNVEAVFLPYEIDNYFEDCKLFKPHWGDLRFTAYALGKSAVRVTPKVRSDGPHAFADYEGGDVVLDHPLILHYPTPTFRRWISKFEHYGSFSDFWYDDPNLPLFPFMTQSRDLVRAGLETGEWEEARKYYTSWIPDAESVAGYLESGGLMRISPFKLV